jgi:hypothetical protein
MTAVSGIIKQGFRKYMHDGKKTILVSFGGCWAMPLFKTDI